MEAQSCIIIHPGSRYLRIGRPSDSTPHTIFHAIARKRRPGALFHADPFLTPQVKLDRVTLQEIEECRLKVSHILQSSLMSDGSRRFATPPQQVAAYNKRIKGVVEGGSHASPPWTTSEAEFVIGDEILVLNPDAEYNIHFPYHKGDFNLHGGVGGSITAVLANLSCIWSHSICQLMEIKPSDFKSYRAVLVIPDIYIRDHVKKLVNLLMNDLGFSGCFVLQDHVAATFGTGLGYACVVDIGDQKTSVSCVEDGISIAASRLRLEYGGGDVTQVFLWLLKKCGFPLTVDAASKLDAMLLSKLKHQLCHLNLDVCGAQEKSFSVHTPGAVTRSYTLQMGDELIVAPLALFYTDLLKLTGSAKEMVTQKGNVAGDPEDPFDENYLRETTRRKEAAESTEADGADDDLEEQAPPLLPVTSSVTRNDPTIGDKLLSLEQAILTSIDRCPSDELKRKMYGCILVVGGGGKFECVGKWLHNRLVMQIPVAFRPEQLEIVTRGKDLDPSLSVWKGAALMTCLEGNAELWIEKSDWNKHGVKILREKCPFMW